MNNLQNNLNGTKAMEGAYELNVCVVGQVTSRNGKEQIQYDRTGSFGMILIIGMFIVLVVIVLGKKDRRSN